MAGLAEGEWGKPSRQGNLSFRFVDTNNDGSKKLELQRVITKVRYPEHRGSPTSRICCNVVGVTSNAITRVSNLVKYDQLLENLRRKQLGEIQRPLP